MGTWPGTPPDMKPEPEPNWRSLYENAMEEIKSLKEEMKEMRQDFICEMREIDARRDD